MKFSILSFVTTLAFVSQALATPAPQGSTTVYHCNGPSGETCPTGYRCCGPLLVGVGGTCYLGTTGICPDL
ncbi:hypothetical protein CPB84DRAFT_1850979 [Gymnopilus junonius]|uniref:Uncharacterized protein n=1 Tax=Gymnopilus junonius TaxID=109634 RepID=A0A9P5TJQ6_GYMJU|nr:hypothetical protein CPB84DRAFT_1850979 [Gymnopilus junonius]